MRAPRVLLVEDEPGLALTLGDRLRAEGYELEHVADGALAIDRGLDPGPGGPFDVILLDVMLPEKDGFEVCRTLRRRGIRTPILMLTARGEVRDRIAGLRIGADDYVTKPFDSDELVARIEALRRRVTASTPREIVQFGDVRVDLPGMSVTNHGEEVELTSLEFQLLAYLIQNEGRVVTRDAILREVWGFQRAPRTRTVDVHVTWLRSKLEPDRSQPRYIRTVRGAGYKFVRDDP